VQRIQTAIVWDLERIGPRLDKGPKDPQGGQASGERNVNGKPSRVIKDLKGRWMRIGNFLDNVFKSNGCSCNIQGKHPAFVPHFKGGWPVLDQETHILALSVHT
jgi:hypothetical protein